MEILCKIKFVIKFTFSGNHGVTKGIWNVLLYECRVSNESGDTAPSMLYTPRENWLQTGNKTKNERKKRS